MQLCLWHKQIHVCRFRYNVNAAGLNYPKPCFVFHSFGMLITTYTPIAEFHWLVGPHNIFCLRTFHFVRMLERRRK